jgi:UDP-N-acetylglucosamine diphosphorylase / glucose-1-phosphate thymidylyltransferase / UDP-N-acetylgalactosamine diphosphorylase / glucosamine-1-phosphate N-acetyltransferase / galactosamine-1-phosphate N-acetyltransferase
MHDRKEAAMRVCLFEDRGVADLEPLTLTRPAFELLCGQSSLADKQRRAFNADSAGFLVRPHLADVFSLQYPGKPINDLAWLRSAPTLLINGRWLPRPGMPIDLSKPFVGLIDNEVAFALLPPDLLEYCSPSTIDDCLETWKTTLPQQPASGRLLRYLWELVALNGEQIEIDEQLHGGCRATPSVLPATVGPSDRLRIDATAQLEPMIVADTTRGPVVIDREAVLTAFTRLEGPCYIGPRTQLHGAKIRGGTTIGPNCRVGGEVEASILQGYSNKVHDGFLGHAYLGEWVNLGAGTQNSDLRNDYGEVRMTVNGCVVPTGQTKVGCFLGDHTKTGLGTLLNTATNAGVFCNLLPSGSLLPKYVPSFVSWWNGRLEDHADFAALMQTATEVMRRRGCMLTPAHEALYRTLFNESAEERRRVLRETELRNLRRSA